MLKEAKWKLLRSTNVSLSTKILFWVDAPRKFEVEGSFVLEIDAKKDGHAGKERKIEISELRVVTECLVGPPRVSTNTLW